ncbi:MAG: limonene-1,2-epoxide hydrolase family protein [Actinomycetota bacterium]
MSSEQVVRDFCKAWERKDMDELVGFMTEDAVYHNIPLQPAKGHEEIKGVMAMFVPLSKQIEFKILGIAADGDTVFTERVDTFVMDGGTISLPVAGVFEVKDGKIASWRDYFDMQQFMSQMPGAS